MEVKLYDGTAGPRSSWGRRLSYPGSQHDIPTVVRRRVLRGIENQHPLVISPWTSVWPDVLELWPSRTDDRFPRPNLTGGGSTSVIGFESVASVMAEGSISHSVAGRSSRANFYRTRRRMAGMVEKDVALSLLQLVALALPTFTLLLEMIVESDFPM